MFVTTSQFNWVACREQTQIGTYSSNMFMNLHTIDVSLNVSIVNSGFNYFYFKFRRNDQLTCIYLVTE